MENLQTVVPPFSNDSIAQWAPLNALGERLAAAQHPALNFLPRQRLIVIVRSRGPKR